MRCKEVDCYGNPVECLVYTDAFTQSKCDTPKVGKYRRSNPGKVISNRAVSAHVVCGRLDFWIDVCVDQLIPGGANLAIDVVR